MRREYWILIGGALLFGVGALIYPYRALSGQSGGTFLGNWPAFSHALFFTLLWAFPYRSMQTTLTGAALVALVVTAFETLQHPPALAGVEAALPAIVIDYARHGVFDWQDILAGLIGVALAVSISWAVQARPSTGVPEQ